MSDFHRLTKDLKTEMENIRESNFGDFSFPSPSTRFHGIDEEKNEKYGNEITDLKEENL